jgi:hypothetical protein
MLLSLVKERITDAHEIRHSPIVWGAFLQYEVVDARHQPFHPEGAFHYSSCLVALLALVVSIMKVIDQSARCDSPLK